MARPLTENQARDAVCEAAEAYGAHAGKLSAPSHWRAFMDALADYASAVQADAFEQAKRAVEGLP